MRTTGGLALCAVAVAQRCWQGAVQTGSPNLSRRALLRAVGDGGNCELGLISEIGRSLAPPLGQTLHGGQLSAVVRRRSEDRAPAVVLLGATAADEGLRLLLRDALDDDGRLQIYDGGVWSDRAAVTAGAAELALASGEASWLTGTAVRVRSATGEISNEVFIADLSRVLRTSRPATGRAMTDGDEIFKDPKLFEQFLTDAQLLRPHLLPVVGSAGAEGGGRAEPTGAPKPQSLEEYLDACASVLGEPMLHFALGLPALPGGGSDGLDAFGGGLDDERADVHDPEGSTPLVIPSFTTYSDYRRRRFQRWCERLVDLAPMLVLVGRVLAVRLIARAAAGQLLGRSRGVDPAARPRRPLARGARRGLPRGTLGGGQHRRRQPRDSAQPDPPLLPVGPKSTRRSRPPPRRCNRFSGMST